MKKQELIKIIELVVRKEVKKQVNEIFIKEGIKSLKKSNTSGIENDNLSLKESLSQNELKPTKPKPKKEVRYTENESLNKILNETANGKETEEWPTMGGGAFDSTKMAEAMGYGNMLNGGATEVKREIAAAQTLKEKGVSTKDVGEDVVNALTRDYSGLMKAMNKKKDSHYRP